MRSNEAKHCAPCDHDHDYTIIVAIALNQLDVDRVPPPYIGVIPCVTYPVHAVLKR
jgi:hypothetical protein